MTLEQITTLEAKHRESVLQNALREHMFKNQQTMITAGFQVYAAQTNFHIMVLMYSAFRE